jgi:release factor glutamine methyltransferase
VNAKAEWTIEAVLRWATDDFRTRSIESPRLDAEVLLAFALGTTRIGLVMDGKKPLAPDELARFRDLVKRRRTREPVAYLRGEREFYGRPFRVDRRVLVPRPDTETLVEVALARSRRVSMSMRALDLCTGSGCVAVSLARERPTSSVVATDFSADALVVARDNALRLGAYNVAFTQGDLFLACDALRAGSRALRFDVIVANPPYIPAGEIATLMQDVRDFEPKLALDGGDDGLSLVRRIVSEAPRHLAPEGILALEVGAGQAPDVAALFEAAGFIAVERAKDYGRIERVVSGAWNPGSRSSVPA